MNGKVKPHGIGPLMWSYATWPFLAMKKEKSCYAFASILYNRLKEAGILTFADFGSLHGGDDWKGRIEEMASTAQVFVPIITPSFVERHWPMHELELARGYQPEKKKFIPVLMHVTFNDIQKKPEKYAKIQELVGLHQCIDGDCFKLQKKQAMQYMVQIVYTAIASTWEQLRGTM
jgi:hypothetical protein